MLTLRRDSGYTLVELMAAIAILGVVMTALSAIMVIALRNTQQSSIELDEMADLQFAAAYFPMDVQGADTIRIPATAGCVPSPDPGGTVLFEFAGQDYSPALALQTNVVTYLWRDATTPGGAPVRQMYRRSCTQAGAPPLPLTATEEVMVGDDLSLTTAPVPQCFNAAGGDVTGAVPACLGAVKAQITVTEQSGWPFVISGRRRAG